CGAGCRDAWTRLFLSRGHTRRSRIRNETRGFNCQRQKIRDRLHRGSTSLAISLGFEYRRAASFAGKSLAFLLVDLSGAFCFFPALQPHRFLSRRGFRLLLASAAPLSQNDSFPPHLHNQSLLLLRPPFLKHLVNRAARGNALQQLLEMSLRIDIDRFFGELSEVLSRLRQNKFFRVLQTAVEVNRADQCFEGVGQRGNAGAPSACFLAATHQQEFSSREGGGVGFERVARNQAGTQFGELPLRLIAEMSEKIFSDDELENCVAQKFQPLVIKMALLHFVAKARVVSASARSNGLRN